MNREANEKEIAESKLFDLSRNVCFECGAGHLDTPCQGGKKCTCRCRNCDAKMKHI